MLSTPFYARSLITPSLSLIMRLIFSCQEGPSRVSEAYLEYHLEIFSIDRRGCTITGVMIAEGYDVVIFLRGRKDYTRLLHLKAITSKKNNLILIVLSRVCKTLRKTQGPRN